MHINSISTMKLYHEWLLLIQAEINLISKPWPSDLASRFLYRIETDFVTFLGRLDRSSNRLRDKQRCAHGIPYMLK